MFNKKRYQYNITLNMELHYTTDKSTLILIALLKAHGIRKIVASPGATNTIFVASIQHDDFFEIYSSVDERSAAYIACGLSQKSREPVAISCTEATASRNYYPGLTEAYYRKLPILAITCFHNMDNIGNLFTQAIDRSQQPKDTIKYSTTIENIENQKDEWRVNFEINKAILELFRDGGGPVHINLQAGKRMDFYEETLPQVRVIRRITYTDKFPNLPEGKIAVVVGSHHKFTGQETQAIDNFCASHNAVVFADLVSGYYGKFRVSASVLGKESSVKQVDLVIHIGEVGWSSATSKQTWRVSEDGEIRDTYRNLTYLFDMDITTFFNKYASSPIKCTYLEACRAAVETELKALPDMPFSNAWIAQQTACKLPHNCVFHVGILNSFRVWNMFPIDCSIETSCNFGGFGIDGGISTLIGSSLAAPDTLHIGVFGDLAFFYDMNVIGNRHVGNNVRIMLINNGKGQEFRNCIHPAYKLGEDGNAYVAAAGHFGNKSANLVKHYASDLGYEYLTASTKEEYLAALPKFLTTEPKDYPMIFEVFTESENESEAVGILCHKVHSEHNSTKGKIKEAIRTAIGDKGVATIMNMLKK